MNQDLSLACRLTAQELQVRGEEIAALADHVQDVQELPDGYAFAFSPDAQQVQILLDFIIEERACCPFFSFTLAFPSPHTMIWLRMQGREGVKEIIASSRFATAIARFGLSTKAP
jgi:hypothetical protein